MAAGKARKKSAKTPAGKTPAKKKTTATKARTKTRAAAIKPLRKTAKVREPDADTSEAPTGTLPAFIEPCLATLAAKTPDSGDWVHEIKFDGYRLQARLDKGKVKLLTRSGLDWTQKFPTICKAIAKLPAKTALIDRVNIETNVGMEANVLTFGFGRRIADYKRADLLFQNLERLKEIAL